MVSDDDEGGAGVTVYVPCTVKVHAGTATISATLFKDKNNKEKSKSINTKNRWTQKIG